LTFVFSVYATSDKIGSVVRMHELLDQATKENPVAGNASGSYLTMRSKSGLIFGVINLVGEYGAASGFTILTCA
jgi:Na+/proline symporter